jgi:alkylhydroperoxidase family enzyme
MDKKISRFPVPSLEQIPEDLRDRMIKIQEKTGFVPNVFLTLAHRPNELRAFMAYHDTLMEGDSGLSKMEREMIVVAINYRKADLTMREHAMLEFALKVASASGALLDEDIAKVRAKGFSMEDVWDIGAITAFFALSNRMANLTSMRPNDEFFGMAR